MKIVNIFFLLALLAVISCTKEATKGGTSTSPNSKMDDKITQGVKGSVLWFEGNLMPSPGSPTPKGKPIVREIIFCKPLKMNEATKSGNFYTNIEDQIVAKTTSDEKGMFMVKLAEGKYSVFTKEEGGYYANLFDGQGYIQAITVKKDFITELDLKVDYKASY